MHYVITAGGTREYIDPVRFMANASTGQMGYALAEAAIAAGHRVTLISANVTLIPPAKANLIQVVSARDMWDAVLQTFPACDCLIMAAAVSDYTPARPAPAKIKKSGTPLTLELEPTPDILAWAGQHKDRQKVVGFALEDQQLHANAASKLKAKNLDMIVANGIEAIGSTHADLYVKTPHADWIALAAKDKPSHAHSLIQLIDHLFQP